MFLRTLPMLLAATAILTACVGKPMPPQVASSPVSYARPTARTGAPPVVEATPVVATSPQAASADGKADQTPPKKRSFIKEPMVVVVPSYRLPSDTTFSP